jgi:uncharacterized damage-inducible protein DinB
MSSDVAGRVDASWRGLMNALEGIPEDRMSEPGVVGVWSVKDLMAHVAFWDERDVDVLEAQSAGREVEPIDWRVKNDEVARERAEWSLTRARQAMHDAHERVNEAVSKHPDADLDDWAKETYEHYDEHAAEVRDWREREGL